MNTPYTYADVLLPLKVPAYTYKVPEELGATLQAGQRVVVQFGQKKLYTAIVLRLHNTPPETGTIKSIRALADSYPIVNEPQLRFWQWISDYYMCKPGEVMQAALPAALKLDSMAKVALREDWDEEDTELSDDEFIITETLRHEGTQTLQQLEKHTQIGKLHKLVNGLIKKEVLYMEQELRERYKPKTESWIRLTKQYKNAGDRAFNELLDSLSRAPRQQELVEAFLHLKGPDKAVKKSDLLNEAETSAATINALVKKNVFEQFEKQIDRLDHYDGEVEDHHPLTPIQMKAMEEVETSFKEKTVCLLHGVTGSGKTHIYFELIKKTLAAGKQVLYLLPEIALTGQIIARMRKLFGDDAGIYHSRFNDQERVEIWHKTLNAEYKIVLGARSSMFLPFKDLGLIIVDEEHDGSFKQFDPSPRYNARDSSVFLGNLFKCPVLLGTATPSLESWFNAKTNKYGYVYLSERHRGVRMPTIEVIDLKQQIKRHLMKSHFSQVLIDEIGLKLDRKEQVILFQNKRGFAPYLICTACSWIPQCKNCDVSLTYHKSSETMRCHYCGYKNEVPENCNNCHQQTLRIQGFGTEKLEEELAILFPKAHIARMDLDSTRSKDGHVRLLSQFRQGEIDILVGTQMVTKGLDFANVSLVGIISADQLLSLPDFRANERAYQLMEQVSGRAGRHEKPGKVLIQAMDPENNVVQTVVQGRWRDLYQQELLFRRQQRYPPYQRLVSLTLKHREIGKVFQAGRELAARIKPRLKSGQVLGPATPMVGRIKGMFLQDILVKIPKDRGELQIDKAAILDAIESLQNHAELRQVQVHLNVDP